MNVREESNMKITDIPTDLYNYTELSDGRPIPANAPMVIVDEYKISIYPRGLNSSILKGLVPSADTTVFVKAPLSLNLPVGSVISITEYIVWDSKADRHTRICYTPITAIYMEGEGWIASDNMGIDMDDILGWEVLYVPEPNTE